jgi:hypothetical protein
VFWEPGILGWKSGKKGSLEDYDEELTFYIFTFAHKRELRDKKACAQVYENDILNGYTRSLTFAPRSPKSTTK